MEVKTPRLGLTLQNNMAILNWLSGKKTTIASVLALCITFSFTKGWIDMDWAIFLNSLLVALGLTANIASYKMNQ